MSAGTLLPGFEGAQIASDAASLCACACEADRPLPPLACRYVTLTWQRAENGTAYGSLTNASLWYKP